jgi:hypothetical protein
VSALRSSEASSPRRFQCISIMGSSIGGSGTVRSRGGVRSREGPLSEVSLYIHSKLDAHSWMMSIAVAEILQHHKDSSKNSLPSFVSSLPMLWIPHVGTESLLLPTSMLQAWSLVNAHQPTHTHSPHRCRWLAVMFLHLPLAGTFSQE